MGGKNSAPAPAPPPDFGALMAAMPPMHHAPPPPEPKGPSLEEQREQQRIEQGRKDRDTAYSDYLDAAGSATDFINKEISKEESNARLLGIDYSIDDAQKQSRINDYFASIWGEGEQSNLEQLMGEFGDPKGFDGFSVKRGDASKYGAEDAGGKEEVVGSTSKRRNILTDEEETLGAGSTVLG